MSRMSAFREWITRRKSSLWPASQASKSTVNGNRRTVYPETADGLRSRGQTPSKTPHCETCTCHTSTTNTHPDLDYLAYNFRGDPYGQAGIREQAKRTASAYVGAVCGNCPNSRQALTEFSYYASRLGEREPREDLGILPCNAMGPCTDEHRIALTAAWTIVDLERCPTRDDALAYLDIKPNHLFKQRLIETKAATEDAQPSDQQSRSTTQQGWTGRGK